MNSQLNKDKLSGKIKNYVNLIDIAFKNAPPTKESLILYRGIQLNKKIETDFTSKTYVSTSSNKSTSLSFSGYKSNKCCFFEITVPKGSRVLPLMYLSLHSQEMEILLSRNSEYKIVKHSFTPKGNTIITKYVEKIDDIQPIVSSKKVDNAPVVTKKSPQKQDFSHENLFKLNTKLEKGTKLTEKQTKTIESYDKLIKESPPISKDMKVFIYKSTFQKYLGQKIPIYMRGYIEKLTNMYTQVTVPKGSQLLFTKETVFAKTVDVVIFPRNSKFENVGNEYKYEYKYIPNQSKSTSPTKQKPASPSPTTKQKSASPSPQKSPEFVNNYILKAMLPIINAKLKTTELSKLPKKYIEIIEMIDKIIKDSPPISKDMVVYVHQENLNVPYYSTGHIKQMTSKLYKLVNIPKGSHLLLQKTSTIDFIRFPRNSKFVKVNDNEYNYVPNQSKSTSPTSSAKSAKASDIEQQINYVKNLPAGESNIYVHISEINEKIIYDEITETDKKMMKAIDKLFEKSPPLEKGIKAYASEELIKEPKPIYLTVMLQHEVKLQKQINIPKGSQLLFSTLYGLDMVRFPRYSKFEKVNDKEYNYIPKSTSTPVKPKSPSPTKQKSAKPASPSKCKPNPKYSPVKYICNEATGKWVLKTGDIGKKLLANKPKSPQAQAQASSQPQPKPKSVAKKVVYTKEQMYDKFKETFKDDLLGFIGKDKPKFRVATSGGYGVKMTLEEKHGIFGKIITKDIDLTVSVYNSTMDGTECYHYLYNKVMKFIKESGDAKNFKVEVLKMYNSFVPIFKYTRYYIIMIEYKKDEFIDLAITNMNMTDKMIDIPLSQKVGLPIKTEEEYLREFLIFVYMENVPGVNDQVYYKRNPVVGKLPAKGQKDILNSKLLCDKVKKKNYEGYCKLLKDITVEKLKAMPKYERDDYFKSLKMITGQ